MRSSLPNSVPWLSVVLFGVVSSFSVASCYGQVQVNPPNVEFDGPWISDPADGENDVPDNEDLDYSMQIDIKNNEQVHKVLGSVQLRLERRNPSTDDWEYVTVAGSIWGVSTTNPVEIPPGETRTVDVHGTFAAETVTMGTFRWRMRATALFDPEDVQGAGAAREPADGRYAEGGEFIVIHIEE